MTFVANAYKNSIDEMITRLGDTITIYSPTNAINTHGDATTTWSSGTSAQGVVIRAAKDMVMEMEGQPYRDRTMRMFIKSSVTVANGYKIAHNSINYEVTATETIAMESTTLYYKVEMVRMGDT